MTEIDKDFYCACGFVQMGEYEPSTCFGKKQGICESCSACHRKHPTLEQFEQEYNIEIKENTPIYIFNPIKEDWELCEYWRVNQIKNDLDKLDKDMGRKHCDNTPLFIICCTPFNKPDNTWRPE